MSFRHPDKVDRNRNLCCVVCGHKDLILGRHHTQPFPLTGSPLDRENRENGPQKKKFGNFAKAQGILYAQGVNSLILEVMDIAIFATKISNSF